MATNGEAAHAAGSERLSWKARLAYGAGDVFGGGSTTTINLFYLIFLTDVVRLSPALAGTVVLISKIWDAVTDPFMGIITDNTRTRFGRRRPYFLAAIGLVFVGFLWMWTSPPLASQAGKFAYALLTYLAFSTVYTVVWVPYNAIAAELTPDYNERTKLSTVRIIFSNLSGIICAVTAKDVFVDTLRPGAPATGYLIMAAAFGLMFALPYIATFRYCKEDPAFMRLPRREVGEVGTFITEQLIDPLKLRPFRSVVFMYLFGFMVTDTVMGLAVYFLEYYLQVDSMFLLLVPVYAGMLAVMPFIWMVSERVGKRNTYLLAGVLWLGAFAVIPFLTPGGSYFLVALFGVLFGVSMSTVQVMVFAMFPDIPDADELFSGRRREGVFSGIFAFFRKAGSAVTLFIIGTALQLLDYAQPLDTVVDGVTVAVPQTQGQLFGTGIRVIFVALPVFYGIIALIAATRYPLTADRAERLKAYLARAREAGLTATEGAAVTGTGAAAANIGPGLDAERVRLQNELE